MIKRLTKWEVFDCYTGDTLALVPARWLARLICNLLDHYRGAVDYAPRGWGWVDGRDTLWSYHND